MRKKSSEVRAYGWIKQTLKRNGFNTSDPNKVSTGEVYTQHECNQHPDLKKGLDGGVPENIVCISPKYFWVIEAKPLHSEKEKAFEEAQEYANNINSKNSQIKVRFITGVAGSDDDKYVTKTNYLDSTGTWKDVTLNNQPISRLLKKSECLFILQNDRADLSRQEMSAKEIFRLSQSINKIFHQAGVEKEKRAPTVAVLLLALSESIDLQFGTDPTVFIRDINSRAEQIFTKADKAHLWNQIKLVSPSKDSHSYANALNNVILELRRADILSASTDSDILGSFFENFLRYGNTAKDLGIVLTPRHICQMVAEILNVTADDTVYDPTIGTGGFVIAGYNRVKTKATDREAKEFGKKKIYGCERNGAVACLAFVNMFFRGDGKHNLSNDSCFNTHLVASSKTGHKIVFKNGNEFSDKEFRAISRVMMNPPFSLKNNDEKEYCFVDHALEQLQKNGLLFTVLPSSVMYSSKIKWWRKTLTENHRILSVFMFPNDLFYPAASTESVGLFVKAWVPHNDAEVLWVRFDDDGFSKWKKTRIEKENPESKKRIEKMVQVVKNWCISGLKNEDDPNFYEFHKIKSDEIIPQAHIGNSDLKTSVLKQEVGRCLRDYISAQWNNLEK